MSNYATRADLKNEADVNISDFVKNTDLANLKSDVKKSNIEKLRNVPSGLNSLQSKAYKLDIGKL